MSDNGCACLAACMQLKNKSRPNRMHTKDKIYFFDLFIGKNLSFDYNLLYHEAKLHDRDLHELCSVVFIISLKKENNKREYKKNKKMKRKKHGEKRTYHTV